MSQEIVGLQVDDLTLRDLEIFETRDGGASVFDLLNQTRTRLGARALRQRMATPLSVAFAIRQVQDAIRFLVASRPRLPFHGPELAAVERYVDDPFEILGRRHPVRWAVEAPWTQLRYPELGKHAKKGVAATSALVAASARFSERLRRLGPPPVLETILDELDEAVARLTRPVAWARWGPWRMFGIDRLYRGGAREAIAAMLEALARLDALWALAEAHEKLGLTLPVLLDEGEFALEGEGLRHLFLDDAVTNPVQVEGGRSLVFLTGPNMAGKTTYLKAVGVAVYLAHCGLGVPADRLRLRPVRALFTSLSPEDNLRRGLSYFQSEVERVRQVVTTLASGVPSFVIFDEIFRGTNVRDALEASRIVILGCAQARDSGFIFASHLTELASDLGDEPSVRFLRFHGEVVGGVARYDFRIREGVSEQRFGLQLLREARVPELLARLKA